jgi:carbonic anhydrase/acetyltransferase-like protein (isoleucine patch superfamily)
MPSRDLRVTLIGEDRTGKAFGSAGNNVDGWGSKLGGFAKTAGLVFGGAAIAAGAFAKTGVDAFARIEDATGAAGVQFGKASADVVKFAQSASTSFGLSTGAALDAANTFGTMGKAAGLSGTDLAKFSTDFTGLAGDLASFKGTSPEQAIEAIGAALRGETEPIRAYGVLLDDASLRQEALSQGLIKTTKEALTPQQKVLAAQALIYKQTGDAQGDFARTSDSTANTAKRLAAETENASAKLGEQLAPAVTVAREAFLNLIQGASGLVTAIGPALGDVMAIAKQAFDVLFRGDFTGGPFAEDSRFIDVLFRVREAVTQVIGVAQQAFDILFRGDFTGGPLAEDSPFVAGLFTAREMLGQVAAVVTGTVVPAFLAFAGFLATNVIPAITAVATFLQEHQNVAKALGVTVGVVASLVVAAWATQAVAATVGAARQVAAWLTVATTGMLAGEVQKKTTAQIVFGWVAQAAAATVNAAKVVAGWIATGAAALAQAAVHVAQVAVMVAKWVFLGAQSLLHAAKVAAAWLIAMGPIGLVIAAVVGLVAVVIANWDTIRAKTAELWDAVKRLTAAAWDAIKGAVGAALEFVKALFLNFTGPGLIIKHWDTIKNATSAAWEAVKGVVRSGIDAVVGFISGLGGRVSGAVSGAGTWLSDAGRRVIQGFIDGITGAFGRVRDVLGRLTSMLPDWKGPADKDARLLYGAGKLVMGGFERGLRDSFGDVRRTLGDATGLIGTGAGGRPSAPGRAPITAAAASRNVTVNITGQVERLDEDRLMTLLARAERMAGVG